MRGDIFERDKCKVNSDFVNFAEFCFFKQSEFVKDESKICAGCVAEWSY